MRLQKCTEAGLISEGPNGVVFNEGRFFSNLSYAEVLELEFECPSIAPGKFKAEYAEAFLEKRANNK